MAFTKEQLAGMTRDQKIAALQQMQGQPTPSGPPAPADPQEYENNLDVKAADSLHQLARPFDYLRGVTGTALGAATLPNVGLEDFKQALKANAPSTAKMLEKAGVPPGRSLSDITPDGIPYSDNPNIMQLKKHGVADPTVRGAAGFAGDIATDPLTYLSFGASAAAKKALAKGAEESALNRLTRVVTNPVEVGGEGVYKSAFDKVDKELARAGRPPVSPEYLKRGVWGNMQHLSEQSGPILSQVNEDIGNTLGKAADQGASIDLTQGPALKDGHDLAYEMATSRHPDVQTAARKGDDILQNYWLAGEVPVDRANKMASEVNKMATKRAFNPSTSSEIAPVDKIERAIGQGMKGEIKKSVQATDPALAEDLSAQNQSFSAVKNAQDPLAREAKNEANRKAFSQVDAMLGGAAAASGALHSPDAMIATLGSLAAKKGVQAANSTLGRTGAGLAAYKTGKYASPLLRRDVWKDMEENLKRQHAQEDQ